jgi:hypothetical protein
VLGDKDVDLDMPKLFWEDLEKVGKIFFQSIGAKKSKIVDKISSKLEILKRDGAKMVFMPKPSTHRMHDPGPIVPHIRPKVFTDNQTS